MDTGRAVLDPAYVQAAGGKLDVGPTQAGQLACAQPVPKGEEDQHCVTGSVSPDLGLDFMRDTLYSGRVFRTLNVLDEANRGALGIDVAVSIPAARVTTFLTQMIDLHGRPAAIRCDNGPELTSQAFTDWCKQQEIELRFIQPGKPDQNAYIERFNRTYREEVLSAYLFDSLDEVREITADWINRYNQIRPHDALGSLPQARYRERLLEAETPA